MFIAHSKNEKIVSRYENSERSEIERKLNQQQPQLKHNEKDSSCYYNFAMLRLMIFNFIKSTHNDAIRNDKNNNNFLQLS
jgi:hypothetical protein